jgi:hypothetical protein
MRAALYGLALVGLVVSARTRVTGTVLGQPVSVPVLGLAAVAVVLALAVTGLLLLRAVVRDWPRALAVNP